VYVLKTLRNWLRNWLGVKTLDTTAGILHCCILNIRAAWEQHLKDFDAAMELEKEQRQAAVVELMSELHRISAEIPSAILKSQGFVPLMNERITALEQTSVNGAGAEAIVVGVLEAYDQKAKRYFSRVDQEIQDLTRELEVLKEIIARQEMKPKTAEKPKEPEKKGREPWPTRRARIEQDQARMAEAEAFRPNAQ
jgi:hypothetical protein